MLNSQWLLLVVSAISAVPASANTGDCNSSFAGCHLNGDCVNGKCVCDPWWSGALDCSEMAFEPQEKSTGYYNTTETSWGGLPIQDESGTWNLFHAQMLNGCGLGSWTSNSIVARSTSNQVQGPYTYQEEVLPNFAHNPTIRKVPGGYVIWYIGGWTTNASKCKSNMIKQPSCSSTAKIDPKDQLREGGDYHDVQLASNASINDCVSACCADSKCRGFSFNHAPDSTGIAPGCKTARGATCCKLKSDISHIVTNGCPQCTSGVVRPGVPPPPPSSCSGKIWDRSCGPNMPGPQNDTCGSAALGLNSGCGISMAFSASLHGPWEHKYLHIIDQWNSPKLYCAHTNPSPFLLPNGTIVMAVNAGYCSGGLETIGLAYSDNGWNGTWRMLTPDTILHNPDGSPHRSEDPFIWKTSRGWHLLVHNMQGPQGESAYGYSLDGLTWTLSPVTPYGCTVNFTDGTSTSAGGCGNRPQLVFSGPNGTPQWITNGAEGAKGWRSGTFTLFRKLKTTN